MCCPETGSNTPCKYAVGEYVLYKNTGIYVVSDIRDENYGGAGEKTYYILKSVYNDNSFIYVPITAVNVEANMRHVLSAEEINAIIMKSEDVTSKWISDVKQRAVAFDEILRSGRRTEILWLIKVLSIHKAKLEEEKRKLYATDAKILASAERIITEEFAFVLNIKKSEVIPYIVALIKKAGEI